MSIKPILFNTDMVRAILDGKKTVTRRVISKRILDKYYDYDEYCNCVMPSDIPCHRSYENEFFMSHARYQPGDILYVRETWTKLHYVDPNGCTHFDQNMYFYAADGIPDITMVDLDGFEENDQRIRWRPSIHMPKSAARIWLKVTDVRVERLQDITEEQAVNEGIIRLYDDMPDTKYLEWTRGTGIYPKVKEEWGYKNYLWHGNFGMHGTGNKMSDAWKYQYSSYDGARDSFSSLWNTTVPLKDWNVYGWSANPWVWVIEFKRCEKPEPCILSGMEPAEDKRPCIGYQKSKEDDEPCEMCKECRRYYGDTQ